MPGPAPKDPARRIRRGEPALSVIEGAVRQPAPPKGLCGEARRAWGEYWADVVAGVVRRSDEPLAERWARNLDRYYRLLLTADAEPLVTGSTGQPRPNPAYELAYKVEASIKDDEKQLGIGPLNRMRLGLALTEGRKSLTELNAEAESGANDDPRAALFDRSTLAGGSSEAEVRPASH